MQVTRSRFRRAAPFALTGIALLAALSIRRYRRTARPLQSSARSVQGPRARLEIVRDRWGTPHIRAGSIEDALFGQGFVHAQDRLWQMDLNRRAASGRLSELVGRRGLEADRFYRIVGFHRAAEAEWRRTSGENRRWLEAYCSGVNAGMRATRRPLESLLLRYRIEPWRPQDSLAVSRIIAAGIATNWETELARLQLARHTAPPAVREHEPGADVPDLEHFIPRGGGASNAWAVDARHTTTGKPLLAGDPHLHPAVPPHFYACHLTGGDLNTAGVSMPGVPGVLLGHNEQIAWSITAALTDTQDLFEEQFDPAGRYWHNGEWKQPAIHLERIGVRGGDSVVERVVETVHGPLITPVLPGGLPPLTLASVILSPEVETTATLVKLDLARNWDEFKAALVPWRYPAINLVYADVDGHIGYHLAGAVPVRKQGLGVVPASGDGSADWERLASPAELPRVLDPESGMIASANEPPPSGGEHPFLGLEFYERTRADRILTLLAQQEKHTVDSFRRIQSDQRSEPLTVLARALLAARPARAAEAYALDLLAEWDGVLAPASGAACVVEIARRKLLEIATRDAFGDLWTIRMGIGPHPMGSANSYSYRNTGYLLHQLERWQANGSWPQHAATALAGAVRYLEERLGSPETWQWGRLHSLTFRHPLGSVRGLARLLNRGPFLLGGDGSTLFQTGMDTLGNYEVTASTPAVRQIFDLSDWDRARIVLPGGQSGNPFSPHYGDQIADWLAMRDHALPFSTGAVDAAAVHRLTLTPL